MFDRCDRTRDLAGDERFAADRTLVIEQNAVRRVHAIGFAVIDRDPISIKLRNRIRRAGIEWRGFPLWDLLRLTEQLRGRGLIEAGLVFPAEDANGLKQAQRSKC